MPPRVQLSQIGLVASYCWLLVRPDVPRGQVCSLNAMLRTSLGSEHRKLLGASVTIQPRVPSPLSALPQDQGPEIRPEGKQESIGSARNVYFI